MIIKLLSIAVLLSLLAACGGGKSSNAAVNTAAHDPNEPLMADVLVHTVDGKPTIDVTFYWPISEVLGGKENKGFGKQVVAVGDPKFNDATLEQIQNLSGQPMYRTGTGGVIAQNVIGATVGDRRFEGESIIYTDTMGRMITVTLEPK